MLVSVIVVGLLGGCRWIGGLGTLSLSPFILTAGAVLPMLVHRGNLSDLGLRLGQMRRNALLLVVSGVCMLVLGFASVLVLRHWSLEPPAAISMPRDGLFLWIGYQFVYIALPEEMFFRGYILSNSIGLQHGVPRLNSSLWKRVSLCFSAGLFAVCHVVVSGDGAATLTFLPGLIFAWLFVKMESLIPVILFHGAANIGYALMLEHLCDLCLHGTL